VPVGEWFKKERYDYVTEHLRNLDDLGLLDMTRVFQLLHQHASSTVNRTRELRALVALSHWKNRFL
jgi:asparagine synthase (glutamine-hydrolysing)